MNMGSVHYDGVTVRARPLVGAPPAWLARLSASEKLSTRPRCRALHINLAQLGAMTYRYITIAASPAGTNSHVFSRAY
jgi:hypothetical protein